MRRANKLYNRLCNRTTGFTTGCESDDDCACQGGGKLCMEQPGGLSVAACRSATASAAVRLFQTHRPHAVRLTVGPYHRRPVPGGVRGTTMELLVHSTRAQVPTRLDSRYNTR